MISNYEILLLLVMSLSFEFSKAFKAENWILEREYPLERHRVQTEDGYILQLHRIPHSPITTHHHHHHQHGQHSADSQLHHDFPTAQQRTKPVVLLQHGFGLSSEGWVLPDREIALAYQLSDAGFDVWLGNQRGNSYSRQHIQYETMKTDEYWNFSFHEIGYYDLAAMFDYLLAKTNNSALHYVGYSQGTTCLLVLLASRPEYREKVRSTHLLAPVAFMDNLKQPLLQWTSNLLLGLGEIAVNFLGNNGILGFHHWPGYRSLCEFVCGEGSLFQTACRMVFSYAGGPGMKRIKQSVLSDVCAAQPAGASIKQILHYVQLYVKGQFQQFDYGAENLRHYRQTTPPAYNISSITNCIHLYYGSTDHLVATEDVHRLANQMPCAVLKPIQGDDKKWNHYDFLWSQDAKKFINENIIRVVKDTERMSNGNQLVADVPVVLERTMHRLSLALE